MKLKTFQIINYRSIKNSGVVPVDKMAVLMGRNEGGKSNILLALESLNPTGGLKPLSFAKDFPREKLKSEFNEEAVVVTTEWELSPDNLQNLQKVWRRVTGPRFKVSRTYRGTLAIEFLEVTELSLAHLEVRKTLSQIEKSYLPAIKDLEDYVRRPIESAYEAFNLALKESHNDVVKDAESLKKAFEGVVEAIRPHHSTLAEDIQTKSAPLIRGCLGIQSDGIAQGEATKWVRERLPNFIYLNEYPELNGHQSLSEFILDLSRTTCSEAHRNFERLCKVAGLDPKELTGLGGERPAERQQLVNRAGASVTKSLQDLWQDQKLKVRFSLDGDNFDTLVTDPTEGYDVEVNLDERSRGLKWFFSFWIAFAADTMNGDKTNSILLLDEPGLFLHALAQKDLVAILRDTLHNQIIYTTHSPFMIPVSDLHWVKTVVNNPTTGTRVSEMPTGDSKTLFPLQAALGYSLSQTLFKGQKNLVVEGISDFHLLTIAKDILYSYGIPTWPKDIVITPVGGAQKVSYMVALLTSEQLKVVVLLNGTQEGAIIKEDLLRAKLVDLDYIALISEVAQAGERIQDIEDLIAPEDYDPLVRQAYEKDLAGKPLLLSDRYQRQSKKYEESFHKLGIVFDKSKVTKIILEKHARGELIWSPLTIAKFESLAKLLTAKMEKAYGPVS
jgi:predicted ATP-dependent endonuclease of OLD family